MKRSVYLLLIPTIILASCGGGDDKAGKNTEAELTKLKKERATLDEKIGKLEVENNKNNPQKATPVTVMALQPQSFNAFIEVQASVDGEQNILATPQAGGVVSQVLVKSGQRVSKGQTLAILDAAAVEQNIKSIDAQLTLYKALYEKQQKLWAQNIGSEVQLMSAKAQYEATAKQKAASVAQRNMYTIVSPINGTVDAVGVNPGEMAVAGMSGIRVVNTSNLKVLANLGENYLGKVKTGDPVTLLFSGTGDSIKTKLSYVSKSVEPISRAFQVEVRLGENDKLHPNMSCKMKIANYQNSSALVIPVSAIQKTSDGEFVFIVEGNKAKAVNVKTGRNSNGNAEILSGLSAGNQVIVEGYQDIETGEAVVIQK